VICSICPCQNRFKPTDLVARRDRSQVIYAQGDATAGLTIYWQNKALHVITWCQEVGQPTAGTVVRETVFTSNPLPPGWHHVAITQDETRSLNFVEFQTYLDGQPLPLAFSNHTNASLQNHQKGYRLDPRGMT
jgi:hypothetical protein